MRARRMVAGVNGGHSTIAYADAHAALAWLVAAGADAAVDEAPRNWLALPKARPAAVARTLSQGPVKAAVSSAEPLARAADSLEALTAAVAGYVHPLRRPGEAPRLIEGGGGAGVLVVSDMPETAGNAASELRAKMLAAIGLDMAAVRLAHLVPWPTVGGRAITPVEVAAFAPFVARAIDFVKPRAVLAFGAAAASLSGSTQGIASARGKWTAVAGTDIPLLATFHPRALDGQNELKKVAWADLQAFKAALDA